MHVLGAMYPILFTGLMFSYTSEKFNYVKPNQVVYLF